MSLASDYAFGVTLDGHDRSATLTQLDVTVAGNVIKMNYTWNSSIYHWNADVHAEMSGYQNISVFEKNGELSQSIDAPMHRGFFIPDASAAGVSDKPQDKRKTWPDPPNGRLPDPVQVGPGRYVSRGLVVDMVALHTFLRDKAELWDRLEVYADFLVFPLHVFDEDYDEFSFGLGYGASQQVTLVARRIEVCDGSALFASYDAQARLTVITDQICGGDIRMLSMAAQSTGTVLAVQEGALGFTVTGEGIADGETDGTAVTQFQSLPPGIMAAGSDAYWLLESSLNVGAALAYDRTALSAQENSAAIAKPGQLSERQELAAKLLSWTSRIAATGADEDCQLLSLNAANMLGIVTQMRSEIHFVPHLDQAVYEDLVEQLQGVVTGFENSFEREVTRISQLDSVHQFVKATESSFADRSGVAAQLVTEAQKNVAAAEKLLDQNSRKLDQLVGIDGEIDQARHAFSAGVTKYKRDQAEKATLGIAMAVIEVGTALGAMATGDEAEAGAGAEAVEKGVEAGEKVAKTVSKIKKLVETIKKIAKMVSKLKDVLAAIRTAQEAVQTFQEVGSETAGLGAQLQVPSGSDGEVLDTAYWDTFNLTVIDILDSGSDPLTEKIDGASNYLQKLKFLAIYGKAVTANSIALMVERQKLLKLTLDQQVVKRMDARLNEISTSGAAQLDQLQRAKILLYQDLLRVKGRVLFYMEDHAAAYRYWAVERELPPECQPSLQDSATVLKEKLTRLSELRLKKMEDFDPQPQPTDPHFSLQKSASDTHPASRWQRVRLKGERIYLNDAAILDPDRQVKIELSTSGHYLDDYHDSGLLQYIADDSKHTFEYAPSADRGDPTADARDAEGFSYFLPTPFTTWTIRILNERSELNLDQLHSLTFELFGNFSESDT